MSTIVQRLPRPDLILQIYSSVHASTTVTVERMTVLSADLVRHTPFARRSLLTSDHMLGRRSFSSIKVV